MKTTDDVGVTFVNTVIGRGILNGIINLSFGVLLFTPDEEGNKVDPDLVVATRLRMDEVCARQLHETLGELLQAIDVAKAEKAAHPNGGAEAAVTTEKPN